MKKFILTALIIIVAVVLILVMAKDMIIKASIEKGVEVVTGLKLVINSLKVDILKQIADIKGINLQNPAGFRDRTMVDMPEIYVDYDMQALRKNIVHMQNMKLDLREFYVIKNEKGVLNLDSLKAVQAQKKGVRAEAAAGKAPQIQIDNLQLKIGKVIFKDYSKGGAPEVQEFDINLNEKYTNITDPNALVSLIVVRALINTTISKLIDVNLDALKGTIADTLSSAQDIISTETLKGVTETIKGATEGLTEGLKLPFGK